MPTQITTDFLKPYLIDGKRHKAFQQTVDIMQRLKMHADGEKPGPLLKDRRPSEDEAVWKYREKIYVEITKFVVTKIINCLSKIRKSEDWQVKFEEKNVPDTVAEGERPIDYFETNFPYFSSLTNWVFNVCLKNYLIDSNAVCAIIPLETDIPKNEYLRPFPFIFNSDRVLDFVHNDYAVLKSTDKATYKYKDQTFYDGDVYYVINTTEIQRWEQEDPNKTMKLTMQHKHGSPGRLPAFKLSGVFKEALDTTFIYESRIDSIVPRLNEAVREYSDLQGGVVTSLNMERWEIESRECPVCNGNQKVKEGTKTIKCKACNGTGFPLGSPFAVRKVKAAKAGEAQVPIPPAGFIQKPIEILELQDKRVEKHMWWALCAVNMEFLIEVPMNESGVSKAWDRDDFDVFVNAVAEDLVAIMDKVCDFSIEERYGVIVQSTKQRVLMRPKIPVPEKFNLLNSTLIADDITKAKTGKINPRLVGALEMDYANKRFQNDPEIREQMKLAVTLNPFPYKDGDEKMSELQNGGITKEDYVISCNIESFVNRALFEYKDKKPNFAQLDLNKQMEIMKRYAQEKITENSASEAVMKVIQGGNDPNLAQNTSTAA